MNGATGPRPGGTGRPGTDGRNGADGARGSVDATAYEQDRPYRQNRRDDQHQHQHRQDDRDTGAGAPGPQGPQGDTVTDTRGPGPGGYDGSYEAYGTQADPQGTQGSQVGYGGTPTATPLPGERMPQQQSGPYHPPQAYRSQTPPGAVRRPRTGATTTPRTRKARLRIAKADPWSVMKVSFLLSIALGVCTVVAAAVLWMVMDAMGVFSTVGGTISEATGSSDSNGFDLESFLSLPRVLTFTGIIAVIDVVLATALATLGAFIYNLSAGFVGGVEVTLAEDE